MDRGARLQILTLHRWLVCDYEHQPRTSESGLYWAMTGRTAPAWRTVWPARSWPGWRSTEPPRKSGPPARRRWSYPSTREGPGRPAHHAEPGTRV